MTPRGTAIMPPMRIVAPAAVMLSLLSHLSSAGKCAHEGRARRALRRGGIAATSVNTAMRAARAPAPRAGWIDQPYRWHWFPLSVSARGHILLVVPRVLRADAGAFSLEPVTTA